MIEKPIVLCEIDDAIAVVTLNNPEKRNALSRAMLLALRDATARIAVDEQIEVVIIAGAGTAFSAGHDLRELVDGTEADYASLFALCTEVMEGIRNLPQPVIAKVQGIATAAGCQLVASCDLVVAAEQATFATPGVKIGLFCSTPAVALARAVSPKKAMEMLLTGQSISAREAEQAGLVNRVVPADRLTEETLQLARQIKTASSSVLSLGKAAFYRQLPLDYAAAYRLAQQVMVDNALIDDAQEGMRAFLQKRPPNWMKDKCKSKEHSNSVQ